LIVATRNADASTNQLLSFSYSNGVWAAPVAMTVAGLRHVVPIVNDWAPLAHGFTLVSESSITYYHAGGTPPPVFGPEIITGAAKIAGYDSTSEFLSDTSVVFNHNGTGRLPALDRRATRILVSNDTATQAYVVNSAGTRVYTYDGAPQIRAFDVSTTANGGAYTSQGATEPCLWPDPRDLSFSRFHNAFQSLMSHQALQPHSRESPKDPIS
jgi:hypothetical protein